MSTYIEIYNAESGKLQISDTYSGLGVLSEGVIAANFSEGQVYGLTIPQNVLSPMFRVEGEDTLVVSPVVVYKGQRVCYLATLNGTSVKYKFLSLNCRFEKATHLAGIEIYKQDGEIAFSSNIETVKIEGHFSSNPVTDSYGDINLETTSWQQFTIDNTKDIYIAPNTTPFGGSYAIWSWWGGSGVDYAERMIFTGGYVFSNDKIITRSTSNPWVRVHTLFGYGDLSQIGKMYHWQDDGSRYGYYVAAGIWSCIYDFNVVRVI